MDFTKWLLKGFSDMIHDWAALYAFVIVGGIFSLCAAMLLVLEGQWLLLSLEVITILYAVYYCEKHEEEWFDWFDR